jgi:hypothetical protein
MMVFSFLEKIIILILKPFLYNLYAYEGPSEAATGDLGAKSGERGGWAPQERRQT